jgi:radical SAM protein with 4Fe4S-binding SPASM domain
MEQYRSDLVKVMDTYVSEMKNGRVLPISHISELVLYLISGRKRGHSACGVELAENYDIINGRVCACADLPPNLGNVSADRNGRFRAGRKELATLVGYKDWLGCYKCGVHFYCGGRCPVQALTGSRKRTFQYCRLMKLHVETVKERIPEIKKVLKRHGITLQNIYDQSAFITRYTDVTP